MAAPSFVGREKERGHMAKGNKGIGMAAPVVRDDESAYRARDDMETLRRAEEIRLDRGRHTAATRMAKTHIKALTNIGRRK